MLESQNTCHQHLWVGQRFYFARVKARKAAAAAAAATRTEIMPVETAHRCRRILDLATVKPLVAERDSRSLLDDSSSLLIDPLIT